MSIPTPDSQLLNALQSLGVGIREVVELFDHMEDVQFWMKDHSGRFTWVNVSLLLNYGLKKREDLIGKTDFDLSEVALANQFRIDDEKVLKGARILSRIELVGRFNHSARWSVTTKVPLRDNSGKIIGTVGTTRPQARPDARTQEVSPLNAAITHINENYKGRISNDDLAKACGMSLRVFHRKFKSTYHSSPHSYVRQIRVRMSCHTLVFSKKSLSEVAGEYGFADQSHFTKEFHRIVGETPRVYRARYQH